ncbi:MAG: hypothetical protein LQ351_005488 [Letrouitia transgressa]|nr:MAG: hypothetical protein LQ351_005488 [Letrouitia transgressa]
MSPLGSEHSSRSATHDGSTMNELEWLQKFEEDFIRYDEPSSYPEHPRLEPGPSPAPNLPIPEIVASYHVIWSTFAEDTAPFIPRGGNGIFIQNINPHALTTHTIYFAWGPFNATFTARYDSEADELLFPRVTWMNESLEQALAVTKDRPLGKCLRIELTKEKDDYGCRFMRYWAVHKNESTYINGFSRQVIARNGRTGLLSNSATIFELQRPPFGWSIKGQESEEEVGAESQEKPRWWKGRVEKLDSTPWQNPYFRQK